MTTARTSSREDASIAAARTSRCNCSSIAFIFGRSRRIVPTPSSTCRVTNSGASAMPGTLASRRSGSSAGGEAAVGAAERQVQPERVGQVRLGEDVVGGAGGHDLAAPQQQRVGVPRRDLLHVVGY